jgi:hypothetical protein
MIIASSNITLIIMVHLLCINKIMLPLFDRDSIILTTVGTGGHAAQAGYILHFNSIL